MELSLVDLTVFLCNEDNQIPESYIHFIRFCMRLNYSTVHRVVQNLDLLKVSKEKSNSEEI